MCGASWGAMWCGGFSSPGMVWPDVGWGASGSTPLGSAWVATYMVGLSVSSAASSWIQARALLNHLGHLFVRHGFSISMCTVRNLSAPSLTSAVISHVGDYPRPSPLGHQLGRVSFFLIFLAPQQISPVVRGCLGLGCHKFLSASWVLLHPSGPQVLSKLRHWLEVVLRQAYHDIHGHSHFPAKKGHLSAQHSDVLWPLHLLQVLWDIISVLLCFSPAWCCRS